MAKPALRIAKLSRPRLHRAIARERLFVRLDESGDVPLVWLSGPPGCGKTTLASTYVEGRRVPCVWYQLDAGDADPANFFYYFRMAARATLSDRVDLPLFTPDYSADAGGFSRRFFRAFFHAFLRVIDDGVVVLDNYQDVAGDSPLHEALAGAVEEVPPGSRIIVLSRARAPASYARARLNERMTEIGWEDMRLDQDEARALVEHRGGALDGLTQELLRRTDGWAGGVTLLLERLRRDGKLIDAGPDATAGAAFDYFESQIMLPATERVAALLMRASLLPAISPGLLCDLTGDADAGDALESLFRRNLFLDRRPGGEPIFQMHPLFQEFLRERAERLLGGNALTEFRLRAAERMLEVGKREDAVVLMLEASAWAAAQSAIGALAPTLIAQGRWQTLRAWIARLPDAVQGSDPWLIYWLGRSQIAVDAGHAREVLARAYEVFESEGHIHGQILSAAAVLEALHYEFRDLSLMDIWVDRVVHLLRQGVHFDTEEDELRVNAAVMIGASNRVPRHSHLEHCVHRVMELLDEPLASNLRVAVCSMLHAYGNLSGEAIAEDTAIRIARPLLGDADVTAATAALYLGMESHTHYVRSRFSQGLACLDRADRIAQDHDLRKLMPMLGNWRGLNERRAGLLDQAQATVARVEALGLAAVGQPRVVVLQVKASVAFARGDYGMANAVIGAAYRLSGPIRFHTAIHSGLLLAYFGITSNDLDTPAQVLPEVRGRAVGPLAENYAGVISLLQAWLELRRGDERLCEEFLRQALSRAGDERQFFRFAWYGNALAELMPFALHREIEVQCALRVIAAFEVRPAGPVLSNWPWPVRLYTLGGFAVHVKGRALEFPRKLPRKAFALLKLLATQDDLEMRESVILDALWPDADGDAAHRALSATLHRLRKLLGDPALVRQRDARVSIDRSKCWVDAQEFNALCESHSPAAVEQALACYRGDFLPDDEDPWCVARRRQLRARLAALDRHVDQHGRNAPVGMVGPGQQK